MAIGDLLKTYATPVTVRLLKTSLSPTINSVIADTDEANFSGYVRVDVTPNTLTWDSGTGKALLTFHDAVFTRSSGGTSNTIYGYAVEIYEHTGATKALMIEMFATPFAMVASGNSITVTVELDFFP